MSDSESARLGRDVFLALAAVGWADGKLDQDEADAIVRTAAEEGLDVEAISAIEEATKAPVDLGVIERGSMTKEDRLFVYAVASWLVRLDGVTHEKEAEVLGKLGDALSVPAKPRAHAEAIAQEIASLPEGDRPARYDLKKLRTEIGDRLREAQRLRAEAKAAEAPAVEAAPAAEAPAAETAPEAKKEGEGS